MFDFSDDETLFLALATVFGVGGAYFYYSPLLSIPSLGRSTRRRALLKWLPIFLLGCTQYVINRWSDAQVKGHLDYLILFAAGALAWMAMTWSCMPILGISIRQDAIDRDNPAAVYTACGALTGTSIIYAFANIGGGPTIWTTLVPAFVAMSALAVVWLMMEWIGGNVAEAITIERDVASGLRCGGVLVGCGIILGRAAGGVWISWGQTWSDMARLGWPAVVLGLTAGLMHRALKPARDNSKPRIRSSGWLAAIGFLATACIVVASTPNGMHPSKW